MKSTEEQLSKRGYVSDELEKAFGEVSYSELICWLSDERAVKRTIAAQRLGKTLNTSSIEPLCLALEKEKALYCKIELCNTLSLFGKDAVGCLVQHLGKIGSNQHKIPSTKKFDKISYPLPRDIAARTLIRIGSEALPELCMVLNSSDTTKISEAIDTIGYICFYNQQKNQQIASLLQNCYDSYADNVLVRWKLIRAMSAFAEMLPFLELQYRQLECKELKQETERSIEIIKANL